MYLAPLTESRELRSGDLRGSYQQWTPGHIFNSLPIWELKFAAQFYSPSRRIKRAERRLGEGSRMNIPPIYVPQKKVMSLSAIVIDNNVVVSVKSVTLVPQRGPRAGRCFPHLLPLWCDAAADRDARRSGGGSWAGSAGLKYFWPTKVTKCPYFFI